MKQTLNKIIALADKLDQTGFQKYASRIDQLIQDQSFVKIAQYVGAIGYVLKQHRALSNCIRQKRVASTGPMQNVVMDCLKEYQDGQSYNNNEWTSKYASVLASMPDQFDKLHLDLLDIIAKENDISTHLTKVSSVCKDLIAENIQDDLINRIYADVQSIEKMLKTGEINLPLE